MATTSRRTAHATIVALALLCALALAPLAHADPPANTPAAEPSDNPWSENGLVILPGHERDILSLLRPFVPGGPVTAGWSIGNVSIRRDEVVVELRAGDARGSLLLRHPARVASPDAVTPRYALTFELASLPRPLRDALIAAIRAHDGRSVWAVPTGAGWAPTVPGSASRVLLDGLVVSLLGVAFLAAALRRHLRDTPRGVGVALALVGALGLALRLAISLEAPMNAWPYSRVVPLAGALYAGPSLGWFARVTGRPISLVDLVFVVDLALASLTPLALFAHARAVLRDWRAALVAALLLATLPMHLRFSRSDVEFIQSLLASSMTFVALYGALSDRARAWRLICFAALPAWSMVTYLTRPENLVFFPLDLAALAVASRGASVPRRRVALAAVLVSAPALVALVTSLLVTYRETLFDALRPRTLGAALATLVSPRFNTLINPSVTPPWVTPLAALGAVSLWRSGERGRSAFLVGWLAAFFVAHSYVRPHEVAMQARYHLHLVTPLLLLAAASTPWLLARARYALAALVAASLAAPWAYLAFERDTAFYEMREFAFVRRVSARVPAGCTVLEFRGVPDAARPGLHFDSRWQRFGARLTRDGLGNAWHVVTADELPRGAAGASERLSESARAVLRAPPPCAMIYLGLSCVAQRAEGQREAAVCDALRTAGRVELVARETITGRVYDSMNVGHLAPAGVRAWDTLGLLPRGTPVTLSLYRYRGADAPPDGVRSPL